MALGYSYLERRFSYLRAHPNQCTNLLFCRSRQIPSLHLEKAMSINRGKRVPSHPYVRLSPVGTSSHCRGGQKASDQKRVQGRDLKSTSDPQMVRGLALRERGSRDGLGLDAVGP